MVNEIMNNKKTKDKIICIYKITSITNGKSYIGSTKDFYGRKWKHLWDLKRNGHCNPYLQAHYNKYGNDDLVIDLLETVDCIDILIEREQHYMDKLNPDFNICKVAGRVVGRVVSQATRDKISKANTGRKCSIESRERMSLAHKGVPNVFWLGRKHTPETRAKISQMQIGKKRSAEAIYNCSMARMGHEVTPETREKLSKALTGKPKSEIHKQHMRDSAKNRPPVSDETREKLSKAGTGREITPTHRKNLSDAQSKKPVLQFDKNDNFIAEYAGITIASNATGIYRPSISMVLSGKLKTAGGYKWKLK